MLAQSLHFRSRSPDIAPFSEPANQSKYLAIPRLHHLRCTEDNGIHHQWDPELGGRQHARPFETLAGDADHREGSPVEKDFLSDDLPVCRKGALPQAISQNDDRMTCLLPVFIREKWSSQDRFRA